MVDAVNVVREAARPLTGAPANYDPLMEMIGDARYRPETERQSHYFYARLPEQFDAVIHFEADALEKARRLLLHLDQEDQP